MQPVQEEEEDDGLGNAGLSPADLEEQQPAAAPAATPAGT